MTLLSYFDAGALAFLPLAIEVAALWFLSVANKASKSNSTQQTGTGTVDNTGNIPVYKIPQFIFFVILQVAAIVSFWLIYNDYK